MSVTFYTNKTNEEREPKNIYELSCRLLDHVYSNYLNQIFEINPFMKNAIQFNFIDIDGDTNVDDDNGIINFYLKGFPEPIWRQILKVANDFLKSKQVVFEEPKVETWLNKKENLIKNKNKLDSTDDPHGLNKSYHEYYQNVINSIDEMEDQSEPRVARIKVNSMKIAENLAKELNWSNSNYNLIINQTLGYYPETDTFDPKDLIQKCQQALVNFYKQETESNTIQFNQKVKEDLTENQWNDESDTNGLNMYTYMLGEKGIKSRLEELIKFCYWAIKAGKQEILADI